jgi:hypothetical protein
MEAFQIQNDQPGPMEPGDERLFVKFYLGSVRNEEKSLAEGRPVFDAVPFVKIMVPGDKNTIIDTFVDANYKRRFARQWNNFQQSIAQDISGTPLRDWAAITRSQAEELNHMNIFTVEQLATLADVYGAKIMGFNDLRRKAQTYLDQAKDSAFAQKMATENQELKNQIAANQTEIKRLSDLFEQMQAAQKFPAKALKGQ